MGTDDPTASLVVPDAIRALAGALPGGWPALMARNRVLALEARGLLADALGVPAPCPEDMIGSLATVRLPDGPRPVPPARDPLQETLFERFRIEVPVIAWPAPPRRLLRVSAQLYNTRADFERLADGLLALLDRRGGARR